MKSIFRNSSKNLKVEQKEVGGQIRRFSGSLNIRFKETGEIRVERPIDIKGLPRLESIHYDP
jgi:hypothetical protein